MSQPYVGQIILVGFSFAPYGYALCDGRLLSISDNDALYALLGTTYGGDGQNTFGLPDLRGRTPLHQGTLSGNGTSFVMGQLGGTENVTLLTTQLPAHVHPVLARGDTAGGTNSPTNAYFGTSTEKQYAATPSSATAAILQGAGGSQPHENRQPFLTINYAIALQGVFPSPN